MPTRSRKKLLKIMYLRDARHLKAYRILLIPLVRWRAVVCREPYNRWMAVISS
jgi:hypothetical protein